MFHICISKWSFIVVCMLANFLRSPKTYVLADLGNAMVWLVSILPVILNSSKPFGIVNSAPTSNGITIIFMFPSFFFSFIFCFVFCSVFFFFVCLFVCCYLFFSSLARLKYMTFLLSFIFILLSAGIAKSSKWQVVFVFCLFFFTYYFF